MVSLTSETSVPDRLLGDFRSAVAAHQPELSVSTWKGYVVLEGALIVSGPDGPFDAYKVQVAVPPEYPWEEPEVFETGGRIPRIADRHVFEESGLCCLGVWEEWLLRSRDISAASFLTGPLHDYFLSQSWFEEKGEWPFGDRSHGRLGVMEAFCAMLGVPLNRDLAIAHLKLLSRTRLKGHALCPCGSGKRLRNCHKPELEDLRERIAPHMAKRMLKRL